MIAIKINNDWILKDKVPTVWGGDLPFVGFENIKKFEQVDLDDFQRLGELELQEDDIVRHKIIDFTEEEIEVKIQEKESTYKYEIYTIVTNLYRSAKERSLNKQNQNLTDKQLEILEKNYLTKEKVAIQIINDEDIVDNFTKQTIEFEAINDFVDGQISQIIQYINSTYGTNYPTSGLSNVKLYCYLIVAKATLGKQSDAQFNSLIELFRSKLLTFLEKREFDKIEEGKKLVFQLNNQTDISGIMALVNKFIEI